MQGVHAFDPAQDDMPTNSLRAEMNMHLERAKNARAQVQQLLYEARAQEAMARDLKRVLAARARKR